MRRIYPQILQETQKTKVLRYCHYSGSPRKTQKKTGKKLDEIFRLFRALSACVRQT